jgi:microsomal dipeptidase-like Zn-dependent dipeptidase
MSTDGVPGSAPRIDGLQSSRWDRELFEEWRAGKIDCVHVTCAIWEDARATLSNLGPWHRRLRENADLVVLATSGANVPTAAASGKTAVILGFQNSSPIEDDLDLVEVFHRLGVRIMQLTYNIQGLVGGSCYEPSDSGLSRFGRQVVAEMNRVGMLVDLSHVGEQTSVDAIEHSARPVAITHANPSSCLEHPRNKSDRVLQALAEHGGVLGCTVYPPLIGGADTSLDAWTEIVARSVDLLGVEHVGIGTDASRKWDEDDLRWVRMGRWTHTVDYGASSTRQTSWPVWPHWFETPAPFAELGAGLARRGFNENEVAAIMGENWLRLFTDGFTPLAGW